MKTLKIFLSIALLFLIIIGTAQDYNMDNTTETTCSGNFYDSGGNSGDYGSEENITMTFYPATPGSVLKFTFTSFDVEFQQQCNWDFLTIYDGESAIPANFYGEYCGTNSPGEVVATNPAGALTFVFESNKKNNYSGWEATIECITGGTSYTGLWIGNTSTDWNVGSNWDDENVPGIFTDVTIPSTPTGGNFPELNSGNEAYCNDLTIASGAHIHIPANNSLSVLGNINNNSGESGIVIKSDISGTGSLLHNNMGVEATVEQYLTHGEWHFIGMPVASEVAGLFDLPTGHSDIYLRTHNEADNTWGDFIVPVETPLELGRGYIAWVGSSSGINQDETIEFNGILNNGDFTTGQNGFYNLAYTSGHGLNLICNPFPSALKADIQNWDQPSDKIAQSVWVWDPFSGNYLYWNGNNGNNNEGYGTLTNGVIPPMQAFFILATKNNPEITIPQSSRLNSSQAFYKESATSVHQNIFSLKVEGNESEDQIFVTFLEEATEGFDAKLDVPKIYGYNSSPQLYTIGTNDVYSINAIPELETNKILDLGFECEAEGEFTFTAVDILSFHENIEVTLEDTKEGLFQNLRDKQEYLFLNEMGDDPNRFKLHFSNTLDIITTPADNINVYTNNNTLFIKLPKGHTRAEVQVFNLIGQHITSVSVHDNNYNIDIKSVRGYYIVKVITDNKVHTKKVFIK